MDGQLFMGLYRHLLALASLKRQPYQQFSDLVIVAVYLWAVLHDRPQGWGCDRINWTLAIPWEHLPSASCLSRRLQSPSVQKLLNTLCDYLWGRYRRRIVHCLDGRPLLVSKSSKDKTATIGPASGKALAKGYKLHVIVDGAGVLVAWAVAPLNHGESTVAKKLVRRLEDEGYLVADSNYDFNSMYNHAKSRGYQLVAPKRSGKGLGHMKHSPHRLRGLALGRQPIGQGLFKARKTSVERFFGNLGWKAGGLSQLPGFVRTFKRVRRWVQGKLIFHGLSRAKTLELR